MVAWTWRGSTPAWATAYTAGCTAATLSWRPRCSTADHLAAAAQAPVRHTAAAANTPSATPRPHSVARSRVWAGRRGKGCCCRQRSSHARRASGPGRCHTQACADHPPRRERSDHAARWGCDRRSPCGAWSGFLSFCSERITPCRAHSTKRGPPSRAPRWASTSDHQERAGAGKRALPQHRVWV